MNEDYYIEFEKEANEMLRHLPGYAPTAQLMAEYGLPKRWGF